MLKRNIIFSLFTVFAIVNLNAQSFHDLVQKTYNFNPRSLTQEQVDEVSTNVGKFWTTINGDTATYLNLLREELKAEGNPAYFYYDGSTLLLEKSKKQSDYQIVADALLKSNFEELNSFDVFSKCLTLAFNRVNTEALALKILQMDKFSPYIVKHATNWSREKCIVWMLYANNEQMSAAKIIPQFDSLKEAAQIDMLNYLWHSCTCEGEMLINKVAESANYSPAVIEAAQFLITQNDPKRTDNAEARIMYHDRRKQLLISLDQEVWDEFTLFTRRLKGAYVCE